MARKNQKLINYHTSSKTTMPSGSSVDYGEIVVRHNAETPELLIKIGEDSFGVFQASGAVKSAIDSAVSTAKSELNTDISNLEKSLSGHVADFNTFKGDVEKTYATKEELKSASGSIISDYTTAIGAAKKEVYDSATTFASSAVTVAKGELNSAINAVANNVETLSGAVSSITTNIGENYVTTGTLNTTVETLKGQISSAKTEAIGEASAYTDTQFAAAKEHSDGKLSAATESLKQTINTVDEKVDTLSGNVETAIQNLETGLTATINKKVATAYRYQKTVTNYADLPTSEMSKDTVGYVYNVENANDNYPAGTNYAWNGTEWDALGGSVDLSPYATIKYVDDEIKKVNQTNSNLKSDIDNLSAGTEALVGVVSAATVATYATKEELESTSGSIITAYTNAIDAAKKEAIGTASGYTDTQVLAAKNALSQNIEAVDGRVTSLSSSTVSIKATADSAVQTASIVDSATCKVSVSKVDTELQFDFSNLVIDCGDF